MGHKIALVGKNRKMVAFTAKRFEIEHHYKRIALTDQLQVTLRQLYHWRPYKRLRYEIMQKFYDAWYQIDSDVWIQKVKRQVEKSWETTNIIVPDVRYMNEVQVLKDLGFTFVRVTSDPSTAKHIIGLGMNTNPGAILYYEHFSPQSIACEYSIHVDNYDDAKKSVQTIINKLDQGSDNPLTY